jgi:polar amino acid transport system substrate-binding protein
MNNMESVMFIPRISKPAILLLFLCLIFVVSSSGARAGEPFKVGYFDLSPHTSFEGEPNKQGAAVEYFKLIAKEMGLSDVSFIQRPLARLLAMLEEEQIDMILLLGKNSTRESKFVYSSVPILKMNPSLALLKSNPLNEIKSSEDLVPLRIGVFHDGYYSPMLRDKRLTLLPLTGENVNSRNLQKMMLNRIDAVYSPDFYSLEYTKNREHLSDQVKIVRLPEDGVFLYSAFSKNSALKYLKEYEKALVKIERERPYEQFLKESMSTP